MKHNGNLTVQYIGTGVQIQNYWNASSILSFNDVVRIDSVVIIVLLKSEQSSQRKIKVNLGSKNKKAEKQRNSFVKQGGCRYTCGHVCNSVMVI